VIFKKIIIENFQKTKFILNSFYRIKYAGIRFLNKKIPLSRKGDFRGAISFLFFFIRIVSDIESKPVFIFTLSKNIVYNYIIGKYLSYLSLFLNYLKNLMKLLKLELYK